MAERFSRSTFLCLFWHCYLKCIKQHEKNQHACKMSWKGWTWGLQELAHKLHWRTNWPINCRQESHKAEHSWFSTRYSLLKTPHCIASVALCSIVQGMLHIVSIPALQQMKVNSFFQCHKHMYMYVFLVWVHTCTRVMYTEYMYYLSQLIFM